MTDEHWNARQIREEAESAKRAPAPELAPPWKPEAVNHPAHYGGDTTYEAIKVIEAWGLGFRLGSTVKYIARADHKGTPIEDLEKARWYLDREIARRKAAAAHA
jgi:hypothetical protein